MLPTHVIKLDMFNGRRRVGDDMLKLPIGTIQDNTGQVVDNERSSS